ncbi:hypothetical protein G7072_06950 [Nocardioides sp. HDW12B]|uniref:hypothetical protein n=1 Tax=Nocardioides sp. HDW12B TaxID=2714939 RepID=UPI00140A48AA|nr:hypothetical protein [Nocardioides sp. HDW12B]QIK66113.1 hypothetical protein G7072_06950 [Nocardioides sp. HDW12B]
MPTRTLSHDRRPQAPWRTRLPLTGLLVALALMGLCMAVPAVFDWNVRVNSFPPIHAEWMPRVGVASAVALVLAGLFGWKAVDLAETLPWGRLLLATYVAALAWMLALALLDGTSGLRDVMDDSYEYMNTARRVTDFPATLAEYVSRISYDAEPRNWPVHIAGHPPGALAFFVLLVRLGVTDGFEAGLVVSVLAATTPVAVLCTLRTLGAEQVVRRAAPFLAVGPAAIWMCVSGDALFAAVGAWGLAALAMAATRRSTGPQVAWSVVAGLLLGYVVMMSYGLPLLGILCLAVLWLGGAWRPLPIAAAAAVAVVLSFAAFGFYYWDALPELHDRYWEGVGGRRTPLYWMWGNLGAFLFSAGPMAGAGIAWLLNDKGRPRLPGNHEPARGHHGESRQRAADAAASRGPALLARLPRFPRERSPRHAVYVMTLAGILTVLSADLSQMSKAEVERIWLPFVPWVLLGCALLPERWRRRGVWIQLTAALVIQHLLRTTW